MAGLISRLRDATTARLVDAAAALPASAPEERDSVPALRRRSRELVATVNRSAGSLPPEGVVLARQITDLADEILGQDGREIDIHARVSLAAVLVDYVPETLSTFRAAYRAEPGDRVVEHLIEQLSLLRTEVRDMLVALRDDDLRTLEIQGSFLATRFAAADL